MVVLTSLSVTWKASTPQMFVAGLRGAIALVLVVGMPMAHSEAPLLRRQFFISSCVFIVIFTNIVLGGLTVPAVRCPLSLDLIGNRSERDLWPCASPIHYLAGRCTGIRGRFREKRSGTGRSEA